ncbi:type I restriction enzyme, S subunit [Micromonospora echinaurantiaca]|uniref:Type I restriction enzyme, S subunit n=1 Tax=Micromonospora echinaurantiaca TaxID=47857 RepID=A0A1C5I7D4_9ACTN|nr:restriction endonuclease subunit S [Micromonospora echinaurantiaca]SCG53796.1 type I restriction enzyme, S subunit [Micromonospora echinaurantiaca]
MSVGLAGLGIPASWRWLPLKRAVLSINRGSAPEYVDDGPVWAVSQAANQPEGIDWSRARFHAFAGNPLNLKGFLRKGDVLLNSTGRGTLGRVGYFSETPDGRPAMADGHVTRVRVSPDVLDSRYAYYYLSSEPFQHYIYSALIVGATNQIELVGERLASASIPVPSIEEQRRIADFLDAQTGRLDQVRASRARVHSLLMMKRERVIEQLIGAEQNGEDLIPLKHLVEAVTVGIVVTPAAWYVDGSGVPALRGINVRPGKIDPRDLVRISHEGHLVHRKSRLRSGDLVVVRTGQAGAAAVVTSEFDGANCIDLVIVRPGVSLVPKFAEYLLNSSYAKRRVAEFAVGSIQSHFNVAAMKAMPVPRKSPSQQQRIVAEIDRAVQPIDEAVSLMQQQDKLLAERRKALIAAAVTGQIDVPTASGVDLA